MAAGLGFKDFVTGEVLTAADVDGYLMQGVWVFASAAARDAAVTSPQEGNFAYLKDTNVTTYYTGSAWANLDTTGMTNPMTTTGDTIYSSSGSTPARLGIGSTGNVLTVAGGVPTWAAPAGGGGMTVLASGSLSSSATTISTINQSYNDLILDITGAVWSANANVGIRVNGISTGYGYAYYGNSGNTATNQATGAGETYWVAGDGGALPSASDTFKRYRFTFPMYALTTGTLQMFGFYSWGNENSTNSNAIIIGSQETADNIDEISFRTSGGQTFSAGTYTLYGVK